MKAEVAMKRVGQMLNCTNGLDEAWKDADHSFRRSGDGRYHGTPTKGPNHDEPPTYTVDFTPRGHVRAVIVTHVLSGCCAEIAVTKGVVKCIGTHDDIDAAERDAFTEGEIDRFVSVG